MSALLERMIQRTRAPLSVVEPRSRPRFASSSSLLDGQESAVQRFALPEAPVPGLGPPQPSARHGRAGGDSPERASTGSEQAVEQRLSPAPRRSVGRPAPGQPSKRQKDDDFAAASEVPGAPPPLSARQSASTGDRSAALTPAAVSGRPAADPLEPLPADAPPGQRTAPYARIADHLVARPLDSGNERRAPTPAPRDRGRAGRGEPPPKVTISIGHIEVRAAPASSPAPPPTPFRPRVSLAAFLGGREERG